MTNVIIIPVHNQVFHLKDCIDSIKKHTKEYSLIIVDDGSTDYETVKWIDDLPDKILIRHTKAMGFSKACNAGIDYAIKYLDFNILCLLNSDTVIVTPDWLDKMAIEFSKFEKPGVASVVSDNATSQTIYNPAKYLTKINTKPTLKSQLIHGFCYFMSRKVILTIGRFDEDLFPHYGSEDDYSLNCIKHGFTNFIVGSIFVKHNASTSYSAERRESLISKSLPALLTRWTRHYVSDCINRSLHIQKMLNETP
jgi:GT2 family glycosyltransferase